MKFAVAFAASLLIFYQLLKLLHHILRKRYLAQGTGLLDLPLLGAPRKDGKKINGTVVVCGGSIAGLLAARVCHDHFERVIVIEAENWLCTSSAWPDSTTGLKNKRSRLVQWDTFQALQAWSASCFYKLFPNLDYECARSKIPIAPGHWKYFASGKEIKPPLEEYDGNLPPILCAGRPGLETFTRRLVIGEKQYPNIQLIQGTITGCEIDSENTKYLSKVLYRRASDNQIIAVPASLVIDCTGPARVGMKIIRRLGYGTATATQPSLDDLAIHYDQSVHYSSFDIHVTDELIQKLPVEARLPGTIRRMIPDLRQENRAVLSHRINDNIIQIAAAGWGLPDLPHNLDELEDFARSLKFDAPTPEWWYEMLHVLKEAEDKSATKIVRMPPSVYIPFHRAGNMPSNWIAIGDCVMSINPVLAQGVSKVLLGIATLSTQLHEQESGRQMRENFANKFFCAHAKKVEPLWRGVKSIDYSFESTTPIAGETLSNDWLVASYIRAFARLSMRNKHASSVSWHIWNFLAPPIDYFHPYFIPQVLLEMLRERRKTI